jgi:hypothetical protein
MINAALSDYRIFLEEDKNLGYKDVELTLKDSKKSCEFHAKGNFTGKDGVTRFEEVWSKIKNFKNDGFDIEGEVKTNNFHQLMSYHIIS